MKDVNRLLIKYCDPHNHTDIVTLEYKLRDHPVVTKWVDRVMLAQQLYDIDDPDRFYGFGSIEQQQAHSLDLINKCIDVINNFEPVIERKLYKIDDQDTLNYLHHIFEVYHGLLDQKTHELWVRAPQHVQHALADLNVLVHRCESVYRGAKPRHVVTWYGLPKTETLAPEDYQWFEEGSKFGTVYLNYVEIGKTLEDLAHDNDQYIDSEAFRPFRHYSADFNIRFWTDDDRQIEENRSIVNAYLLKNKQFFETHDRGPMGSIPLADLEDEDENEVLSLLESRQYVKSVLLI
jgi:hypothetical protein